MNWLSTAVARCEMKVSSVSPDLCEMAIVQRTSLESLIASRVSLTLPIWFQPDQDSVGRLGLNAFRNSGGIGHVEVPSPMIFTFLPSFAVILAESSNDSSEKGSSRVRMG